MNRSRRGFGLTGVAVAVIVMIVTAVFSSSAKANVTSIDHQVTQNSIYSACENFRD